MLSKAGSKLQGGSWSIENAEKLLQARTTRACQKRESCCTTDLSPLPQLHPQCSAKKLEDRSGLIYLQRKRA
jgi:hypothetical protein